MLKLPYEKEVSFKFEVVNKCNFKMKVISMGSFNNFDIIMTKFRQVKNISDVLKEFSYIT